MKVDAFALTQRGKRTVSFLSQALGLMADLDIGTEHLRWMGDARFVFGFLRGGEHLSRFFPELLLTSIQQLVVQLRPCPIQLSVKVAESDKRKIGQNFHIRRNEDEKGIGTSPSVSDSEDSILPPLKYLMDDTDGWVTIDEPILYLYAGKGPYVSR
jgi:sphingosine kinase